MRGAPQLPPAAMIEALARPDQVQGSEPQHHAQPRDETMGVTPTAVDSTPAATQMPLTADTLQALLPQPEQTPPPPVDRASDAGTRRSNPY
eukprot:4630560-Amphidinium_carterae.1